ncbi:hypothetical protein BOX15_Mlig006702g1 [Macrostomum lignano]|uniref:Uncharacterized protein n=1 Tax=Macrostomum lignano TaxID=282301 RepID=A0A267E281_9PLAT|nr:hypothetical protein BOX15_Mlig006702g1 [Macrostomum lignano]
MVKKRRNAAGNRDEEWRSDPRFGHVSTDPRYRSASARKATRVEIDDRFGAMFTDPEFSTSVRSDKRGRPVAMSSRQDLSRFYGLKQGRHGEDEDDNDEVEASSDNQEDEESEDAVDKDEDEEDEEVAEEESDSDEEDDDDDEQNEADNDEGSDSEARSSSDEEFRNLERSSSAAIDEENDQSIVPTNRLAVTQQDWEQIKATDLFMLLSSHCPSSVGRLLSVTVYPSKFGQRRMAEEAKAGPLELRRKASSDPAKKSSTSSGSYRRSLRRYQLKRLWYYYAVAEFDCTPAAASVYEQCSGLEVESTGGCLRLSYVPAGMEFGGPDDVPDEWRHLVTRCTGLDPAAYKPRKLTAGLLNRTKVGLTWDETPTERTRYLQGLFNKTDFNEDDPDLNRLSEFLNLSSDESDNDEEDSDAIKARTAKLRRALLGDDVGADKAEDNADNGSELPAAFSDDELPDDIALALQDVDAKAKSSAKGQKQQEQSEPKESRKRTRRRRLKEQAKRAKLAKAGLLPSKADGAGGSGDSDEGDSGEGEGVMPASEQELAMLVADRVAGAHSTVTAADVAADERFGALFTDPNYHVDPTHSEASKAVEVQKLIVGAKRKRAAFD